MSGDGSMLRSVCCLVGLAARAAVSAAARGDHPVLEREHRSLPPAASGRGRVAAMVAAARRTSWRCRLAGLTLLVGLMFPIPQPAAGAAANPCAPLSTPGPSPPSDMPPLPSIGATPATVSVGQAVSFDGSGSRGRAGAITRWCWTFGDGTRGLGATTSHAYAAPGAYTVMLTVTDVFGLTARAVRAIAVAGPATPPARVRLGLGLAARDAADRLRPGEHIRLFGAVIPPRRGQVAIERRSASGAFKRVVTVTLGASGSYSARLAIVRSGTYRARLLGTTIASRALRLRVRPIAARS